MIEAQRISPPHRSFDGFLALGCVIRGDTPHFEYVAGECARGLNLVALETDLRRGLERDEIELHAAEDLRLVETKQPGLVQQVLVLAQQNPGIFGRLRALAQNRHDLARAGERLVVSDGVAALQQVDAKAHVAAARARSVRFSRATWAPGPSV